MQLEHWFEEDYTETGVKSYLKEVGRELMTRLNPSADRTIALRKLQECIDAAERAEQ